MAARTTSDKKARMDSGPPTAQPPLGVACIPLGTRLLAFVKHDGRVDAAEAEQPSPLLLLNEVLQTPNHDWELAVEEDGTVVLLPPGFPEDVVGIYKTAQHGQIDVARINARLTLRNQTYGSILTEAFGLKSKRRSVPCEKWALTSQRLPSSSGFGLGRNDLQAAAVVRAEADLLAGVTRDALTSGDMPVELRADGWRWDEGQLGGMNVKRAIVSPSGHQFFLKAEENLAAAQAEIVFSCLALGCGFQGIPSRTFVTDSGVVVSPALGNDQVRDAGSFADVFLGDLGSETSESLRVARAWTVVRIGLKDLNLADPQELVSFVVLNALLGNSDRHMDNIHYGVTPDPTSPFGFRGVLLPLDHGRAGFNNRAVQSGDIAGSPADAIVGNLADGSNPHQLLRAFTEWSTQDQEAERVVAAVAGDVGRRCELLMADAAWAEFAPLLASVRDRAVGMADNPHPFISTLESAVSP